MKVEAGEAVWRQDSTNPIEMSLRCLNFPSSAIHRRNVLDQVKENLGTHEVPLFCTLATEQGLMPMWDNHRHFHWHRPFSE